jgi:hypothetical protein
MEFGFDLNTYKNFNFNEILYKRQIKVLDMRKRRNEKTHEWIKVRGKEACGNLHAK